ncbi:hypothetical protein [uncultured Aliiroseovarius sp.]|uniref:hypothetical protein n=1 Tax=uncultured Aliiroseovarius sp. TaxID=1658783 RepID=UPI00260E8060|nr:hypothetical protein [uncultured Aliiroseovarius sp.]
MTRPFATTARFLASFMLASPALATDWQTRTDDVLLSPAELSQHLTGNTLIYYDQGRSAFYPDGRYVYTYGGGGTWLGQYVLGNDSTACVTFVTGVSRCDLYVMNDNALVVITEDGLRFPIQSVARN